ncbi:MAG TPA: hypothetical protein VGH99_01475 [Pseudonocardia sp.]|jgi:hypothetical protein
MSVTPQADGTDHVPAADDTDRGPAAAGTDHAEATPDGGRRTVLAKVVGNPFIGFAPWIVLAVLEGPGRLAMASAVALVLSIAFLVADKVLKRSTKILAVVDVVAFAAFLVMALLASPATLRWMEVWFGELANLALVLVVAGSMAFRVPFTIQYAREEVDPAYWTSPVFIRINYLITGVWGLAFLVSSIAGFYGDAVLRDPDNLWTGWIIQVFASLVALQFTLWYPDYASARAHNDGDPGAPPEPVPPVASFLAKVLGYLVPTGVIALIFAAGPVWLGIGLIVVGAVGASTLRRSSAAEPAH